jgi:hypothetical protein
MKTSLNQKDPPGLQGAILVISLALASLLFCWILVSVKYAPLRATEANVVCFLAIGVLTSPALIYLRKKLPNTPLGLRLRRAPFWLLAAVPINFGMIGLIFLLNDFLDGGELHSTAATVTGKGYSWAPRAHYPQLHYEPFTRMLLPFALDWDESEIVHLDEFEQAQVGSTKINIIWQDGFLKIPWKVRSSIVH